MVLKTTVDDGNALAICSTQNHCRGCNTAMLGQWRKKDGVPMGCREGRDVVPSDEMDVAKSREDDLSLQAASLPPATNVSAARV